MKVGCARIGLAHRLFDRDVTEGYTEIVGHPELEADVGNLAQRKVEMRTFTHEACDTVNIGRARG